VTASRRADGTLIDAHGQVVGGYRVDAQGWIVNTEQLVDGKPIRTNYRLSNGHVVDSKGIKLCSDYDVLSIDEAPLNRSRDMFKHGANRENYAKDRKGIYQIASPKVGETFTVFDADGSILVGDRLSVQRLLEGRRIPVNDMLP